MSKDVFVTELVADDTGYGQSIDRAVAKNLLYQKSAQKTVRGNKTLSSGFNSTATSVALIDGPLGKAANSLRSFTVAASSTGFALTALAGAGVSAVQSVASNAVELENMARMANMSVEEFQAAAYATEQYGISAAKLADISKDAADKLGDFIATGGGEFKDFFEQIAPQIGLTAQELQGLSGPQFLGAVQDAMDAVNLSAEEQVFYLEALANDASLLSPLLANNSRLLNEQTGAFNELGIAMSAIDIETMREADKQIKLISKSISNTFAKGVVEATSAISELAANEEAAEAASLAMYVAAGRLTGAITTKTAATYQDIKATKAAEQANTARLTIESKAAKSAEMAARSELEQAERQNRSYALLSKSAKQTAAAKKTLATAQKNVAATAQQATVAQNALTAACKRGTIAAKGLTVASRTLNGAMGLIGGPAGAVMMAVGALAYLVTSSDDAAQANRDLASSTDTLIDKLDTLSEKKLNVARLDADAAINQLNQDLQKVARDIENTPTTVTISAYATGGEEMETVYQAGIDKVTRLEAEQEDLNLQLASTEKYLKKIDEALNSEGKKEPGKKKPKKEPVVEVDSDAAKKHQQTLDQLKRSLDSQEQIINDSYQRQIQQIESLVLTKEQLSAVGYTSLTKLQTDYLAKAEAANTEAIQRLKDQENAQLNSDLDRLRESYASKETLLLQSTLNQKEIVINAQNENLIADKEAKRLLKQIQEQHDAEMAELARAAADQNVEIQRNAMERMLDGVTGDVDTTDQMFQGMASGMSAAITDAALTGELSFGKMAESIIADMMKMYVQAQIVGPMMQAMGFSSASSGVSTTGTTTTAGVNHTGGIAGVADAGSRSVSSSVFAGAPRFHTGGIVGSEVPIIAQRGEGVFTEAQMSRLAPANRSQANVSIQLINNGTPQEVERTEQSQNGDSTQIKMWIRDIVNSDLNSGQGIDRTLRAQYPSLARRGYG